MDAINFAAWIIIGAAVGKVVFSFFKDRKKRVKEPAASFEYKDSETSEERKRSLAIRYPQLLIPGPANKYWRMAEEDVQLERRARKEERPGLVGFAGALISLLILGAIGLGCFAVVLDRFYEPTSIGDAWLLLTAFLVRHVYEAIVVMCSILYFTAHIVKFARTS